MPFLLHAPQNITFNIFHSCHRRENVYTLEILICDTRISLCNVHWELFHNNNLGFPSSVIRFRCLDCRLLVLWKVRRWIIIIPEVSFNFLLANSQIKTSRISNKNQKRAFRVLSTIIYLPNACLHTHTHAPIPTIKHYATHSIYGYTTFRLWSLSNQFERTVKTVSCT